MRVAAIGLDAMESTLVERLMAEGSLPNLRAIRDRAVRAEHQKAVARTWR